MKSVEELHCYLETFKEGSQFMFYSSSKDVSPGFGASEILSQHDRDNCSFSELQVCS